MPCDARTLERIESLLRQLVDATARPLSVEEAAAYLHCSPSFLYQLTCKRLITHYKAGKKIFFCKKDLDQFVLRDRRGPVGETDNLIES